ncbi:MAG: tripartite tricarboxylate transporter substrate-binding protein [Burkholderiaceae bacterium]|nr:tripartite tricarboxylate transporter substrate-binding protein [Burkholderiaceae bacterium]
MTINRRDLCTLAALGLASHASWAQEWPAKQPVRIIVPYPAGGNADAAARALAEQVSGALKQTILIDNRPGASSIIGTEAVSRAPADGYTLGVVSDSHAINHAMAKLPKASDLLGAKVPYDAVRDFVPVSGLIQIPLVLVIHPKVPARSVKELVQLSQKNGKGSNFGTMGTGSPWFLHMHQLNNLTGSVLVDVPYKGLAPAATDLLGGQIDAMVMPLHYALQHIKSGKLLPLATLGTQRHPLLADVPTLAESGYPGLSISNYLFIVAPANTPKPVVERLGREFNAALKLPLIKEKFAASGDPYPAEPAELAARLNRDIEAYGSVIQKTIQ